MQQSISILIVRTISNRIRACVRTRDVMKSVENGWVCSGQQSVLPPLFTRKEVQLGSGAIHEPRERRRGEEEAYTHLVRRVYQILPQRLLERVCATVFRTTDEARLCFNARMIRIYAHASPKNVIQGSAAHAYLQFAYENFVTWYAQRFSNFYLPIG